MSTTFIDKVLVIEDFIKVNFDAYRSEAAENPRNSDSEYFGYRVNPSYVARRLAIHAGLTLDCVNREEIINAIHVAAENEWVYKDRENRG